MKTKYVNRDWLEAKISEINEKIMTITNDKEATQLKITRNFYVGKLIEMDEYNQKYIELEEYGKAISN